jgi:hypothetical protein
MKVDIQTAPRLTSLLFQERRRGGRGGEGKGEERRGRSFTLVSEVEIDDGRLE